MLKLVWIPAGSMIWGTRMAHLYACHIWLFLVSLFPVLITFMFNSTDFGEIYLFIYCLNIIAFQFARSILIFLHISSFWCLKPGPAWRDLLISSGHVGWLSSFYNALRQKFSREGYWIDCPLAVSARKLLVQFCSLTGAIFPSGMILFSFLFFFLEKINKYQLKTEKKNISTNGDVTSSLIPLY